MGDFIYFVLGCIASFFLSYTFFANMINLIIKHKHYFTLNYELMFFDGTSRLFAIATILACLAPGYYLLSKWWHGRSGSGKNKENYSKLMSVRQAKKRYTRITFDRNGIYLSLLDKMEISKASREKKFNSMLLKIKKANEGLFYNFKLDKLLKHPKRKKYEIGDEKKYYAAGFPFVSRHNKIWLDPSDSHTLIVGTTNSGKTITLLLPLLNIVRMCGESGVVVDLKGELSQTTYEDFKKDGYKIIMIDFIEPVKSDGWNPLHLAWVYYNEENQRVQKIKEELLAKKKELYEAHEALYGSAVMWDGEAEMGLNENGDKQYDNEKQEVLVYPDYSKASSIVEDVCNAICKDSSAKEQVWNNLAADVMKGAIYLLLEYGDEKYINLPSVKQVISVGAINKPNEDDNTYLKDYMMHHRSPFHTSYEKLATYMDGAEETSKSIKQIFDERIDRFILSQQIRNMISDNTIDFENIDKQKTIIFLKVHDEKDTYYSLVTVFMHQLYLSLIKQARENKEKGIKSESRLKYPFHYLWDEFGNSPTYEGITGLLSAGRSRGIKAHLVIQGFDQLESKYGREKAKTIKNNCTTMAYLLSGDNATLDEISKAAGYRLIRDKDGKDEKTEPIFSNDRLKKFQYGEVLILRQREQPFYSKMLMNSDYIYYKKSCYDMPEKRHPFAKQFDIRKAQH